MRYLYLNYVHIIGIFECAIAKLFDNFCYSISFYFEKK